VINDDEKQKRNKQTNEIKKERNKQYRKLTKNLLKYKGRKKYLKVTKKSRKKCSCIETFHA
jgi:hypothetical protein